MLGIMAPASTFPIVEGTTPAERAISRWLISAIRRARRTSPATG